jgi:hypothetical protein
VRLDQLNWSSSGSWDRATLQDPWPSAVIYRFPEPDGRNGYSIFSINREWYHLDDLAAQAIIYYICNYGTNHGTT